MTFEIPNYTPDATKDPRDLYAVVIMFYDSQGNETKADTIYTHADSITQAKFCVASSYTKEILSGKVKIIEAGLAVGWFVQDEHGEVLTG